MAYIEFNDVVKSYGEGDVAIKALDGASFCVEEGEPCCDLRCVVREVATTALNILGGMDSATSGEVMVDGQRDGFERIGVGGVPSL